jgi:hypothetical protein
MGGVLLTHPSHTVVGPTLFRYQQDNGGPPQQAEQTPEAAAAAARAGGNLELFAGRLIPIIGNYQWRRQSVSRAATLGGLTVC